MRKVRTLLIVFILTIFPVFIFGCSNNTSEPVKAKLIIADQFGLAYAPIEVMKQMSFLESELERQGISDIEIEWKRMGNTTVIREAMLAGDLDIAFVGIPPFLIGVDNGMDWKIITAVSESPSGLVTNDPNIDSLEDLTDSHRIILPQPGSIQHILLSMYAEREYGDSKRFDKQLITMSHPDGLVAMSAEATNQLHFTTPPFLQKELIMDQTKLLVDGETCFGDEFTFIVGICQERIYEQKSLYKAFSKALTQSVEYMNASPQETIDILAQSYEYTREELVEYLSHPQMKFGTEVKGLDQFVEFMKNQDILTEAFKKEQLIWRPYEE